eukprot:TRINITY_DN7070_c0_g1_i10.p4 TRINITY_DN7070_c0_g1~~TRINITY_DN7070_c0_g1_i10.p4  ORF type:complete len:118 (-),score=5.60 TRINITY_DN7070_c0_g1_i10:71-424(-)
MNYFIGKEITLKNFENFCLLNCLSCKCCFIYNLNINLKLRQGKVYLSITLHIIRIVGQLMKKVYRKLLQCFQQVGIVPVDHDLWVVGAQFLGGVAVDVFVFARMLLVVVVVCMVGLQ